MRMPVFVSFFCLLCALPVSAQSDNKDAPAGLGKVQTWKPVADKADFLKKEELTPQYSSGGGELLGSPGYIDGYKAPLGADLQKRLLANAQSIMTIAKSALQPKPYVQDAL